MAGNLRPPLLSLERFNALASCPSSPWREIIDEEFHHPITINRPVALVGSDLNLKAFARSLKSLDELHGIVGVNVVVGGAIVDQQTALEIFRVSHDGCFVVALLVFLRKPHVALGVDRVIVAEISDGRGGARRSKNVGIAQETEC